VTEWKVDKPGRRAKGDVPDAEALERVPESANGMAEPDPAETSRSRLVLVGASHHTTPLQVLESIAFGPDDTLRTLPELQKRAGLNEVLLLSTCNRTEIYGLAPDGFHAAHRIEEWILDLSQRRSPMGSEHLFLRYDRDAAEHLFRVASGVDSMILGETEIVGQVQDALELAKRAGTAGAQLSQLLTAATRTQKRARHESAIGEGSVSMASAAAHLAQRIFGELSRRSVFVVGAGETGRLVAQHFHKQRPQKLVITNRTLSRAEALARELDGSTAPLDLRAEVLRSMDVVICATRTPEPLFTVETVKQAISRRASRILLIIDVSLPRNVEREVGNIENVFLHDMYDLRKIVEQNLTRRERELPIVERIVQEEVGSFQRQQAAVEAGPLIRELRERFEDFRKTELDRYLRKFSEQDRPLAERLTRDLINKLLHRPTVELRSLARDPDAHVDRILWVRRLFGLDRKSEDGDRKR
jgi:glutamyl-tRNA reductase